MLQTIIIIALVVIISSGLVGLSYYYRKFKDLFMETKDLVSAITVALKDGKLTGEEKEQIIAQAMEMSPTAKSIKDQFVADAKDLGGKITAKVKTFIAERKETNTP